jgi:PKD repeat protein
MTAAALALFSAACTVDKQQAPSVSAPSGFGLSVTASASPDVLPRDGQSTSTVRFAVQDYQGKAVAGQRLDLTSTAGSLSAGSVTTDTNGAATVRLTAPAVTSTATEAVIQISPVGADQSASSSTRFLTIGFSGPNVPVVSFTFTPATPLAGDLVSFNASATTLGGQPCFSSCNYRWDFGDGGSTSGTQAVATHRFTSQGSYVVTLTVVSPEGVTVSKSTVVPIGVALAITADFTISPTSPKTTDIIYFDGGSSKTPDGAAITSYRWDFGDGNSGTDRVVAHQFAAPGTYTVRLTVTDEGGRTATTTKTVSVS